MIKHICISLLLYVTTGVCLAERSPLEFKIQEGVSFYHGFNKCRASADRAVGNEKPTKDLIFTITDGIKGKALTTDNKPLSISYMTTGNLSLSKPGAISIWIKPVKWLGPKNLPVDNNGRYRKRLFQPFFLTNYSKYGYLGFQRMTSHAIGRKDRLHIWFSGFKGIQASCGTEIAWNPGTWHNVVMTWTPQIISLYLDGHLESQTSLQRKIKATELSKYFSISCPPHTSIDEFFIYNYALPPAQIKKFYNYYKANQGLL